MILFYIKPTTLNVKYHNKKNERKKFKKKLGKGWLPLVDLVQREGGCYRMIATYCNARLIRCKWFK